MKVYSTSVDVLLPKIVSNQVRKREFPGVGDNQKESHQLAPDPGSIPTAREMAHAKVSRLEKALEAMGDLQGPVVDVLKADLAKAKGSFEGRVAIDECRKFITRAERRIRAGHGPGKEQVFLVEAQERLERLVDEQSRCPETPNILPGSQVTALQQMVRRDALAKELTAARSTISEDLSRHAASRRTWSDSVTCQTTSRIVFLFEMRL